ncbi:putative hydrolase, alpha/beta hydrolase family [Nocardia nova SH22a]|uniref:Putative hydrolase, alpha/beta hydrolase family n=1 Tax=Nocardia nova SH22a TaxID=1415166 RepID=W5TKV2_9NOCA|nr:alpha/beta fold hydrolase [Nocardia nova]AHH19980.1 putative hydrolase, alpha/beta hydrolase family [Nocardia nova SH22a]
MTTPSTPRPRPTRFVDVDWGRLAYTEHGDGKDVVVLLHQFLVDKRAQWPIAEYLAAQSYRVICVDLPGHGESDAPRRDDAYGLPRSSAAVLGLLDALDVESAFLGGASFGSLHALCIALTAPERLRGLWLEMPILDRGIRNSCYWGGVVLSGYSAFSPLLRLLAPLARRGARRPDNLGIALGLLARDPDATRHMMVGTLGHGLKPWIADWRSLTVPTLVMGHPFDPVHVLADAEQLAAELPRSQYLRSSSIAELRSHPERSMPDVARFVAACFDASDVDLVS